MVFVREVIGLMFDICEVVESSAGSAIDGERGQVSTGGREIGDALCRERRRIARELHDVIGHRLVVIMMMARRWESGESPQACARTIDETARDAMAELRKVIGLLRRTGKGSAGTGSAMIDSGSKNAVAEIVDLYSRVSPRTGGLHFENAEKERILSADVRHTTVRVVQEGLTNALKYGAGAVDVTVSFGDNVRITMVNEVATPVGADPAGTRPDGGLQGLSERVAEHGGSFGCGSVSERQFYIQATMPSGVATEDAGSRGEYSWTTSRS